MKSNISDQEKKEKEKKSVEEKKENGFLLQNENRTEHVKLFTMTYLASFSQ